MPEFVLKLHDIDELGKDFHFPLTAEWLDAALLDTPLRRDAAAGPGSFDVHAQRNDGEVLVNGHLETALVTECSRCLSDTAVPVDTQLTVLLTRNSPTSGGLAELELSAEDLDRQTARFEGNQVVLDDLVREHLVLECPMQPLCSAECAGIQIPQHIRPRPEDFGGEGAIDPRLAPLQALKAKLSKDKE